MKEFNYFIYNGVKYTTGTMVKLKSPTSQDSNGFGVEFRRRVVDDTEHTYCVVDGKYTMEIPNFEDSIECIVIPVLYEEISAIDSAYNNFISKKKNPDVFNGTLWYIIIMIIAVIFYDRIIIWTGATVIWFLWMINKYKD